MALATPLSAALADRFGRRPVLLAASALAALVGLRHAEPAERRRRWARSRSFASRSASWASPSPRSALCCRSSSPPASRYTGASSAYNLGGILGASLAPYLAQVLLERGGLAWVGYYIVAAAAISFVSLLSVKETAHTHAGR